MGRTPTCSGTGFRPKGVKGVHGEGDRADDRNLVEEAKAHGYQVVFTLDELRALPADTGKVLGLFASYHTFNDVTDEELAERGWPQYWPEAPTLAQMTEKALQLLARDGERSLLVVEEEGPDNFGNHNNASGMLEALRRADEAFGVSRDFVAEHPDTLLITCADSDAGGTRMMGLKADQVQQF